MKKFLPYIFTLVILANILAPISVVFTNNQTKIITQKVEAANEFKTETTETGLGTIEVSHRDSDGSIEVQVVVTWKDQVTKDDGIDISLKDEAANSMEKKSTIPAHPASKKATGWANFVDINDQEITRGKKYTIFVSAWIKDADGDYIKDNGKDYVEANPIVVDILTTQDQKTEDIKNGDRVYEFDCYLNPWSSGGTWSGCFTGIFSVIFKLAAWVFSYAGMFFDWTVGYSLDSDSYRSAFVTEGWGVVRDMCNIFFIFILLYVAFATVLNLHGFKTKEMIVNVVIIGLLINFSLFATHLIIDTSNIMARVFYNNIEVNVETSSNGTNTVTAGMDTGVDKNLTSDLGEKHLSAALISKVNPQEILLNAEKFDVEDDTTKSGGISASTYIIVTFLSTVMCIIGIIVFLSVGLIFIARVIGLWLAMILVPLTFFSYTVPQLQDIDMVGWKKWWPETLKLAFLAPVFMFFLYLIIKFLNTGLGLFNSDSKEGIQWIMGVIIPFAFLMILLWKAKGIATKMSGELGQQITGALAATAGLALGGAALGTAFIGRQTMGRFSKLVVNDSASQKAYKERNNSAAAAATYNNLNRWQKFKGRVGSSIVGHEKSVDEKAHSVHTLDEKAQAISGRKDATYKDLNAESKQDVRDSLDKDLVSKELYGKKYDMLKPLERTAVEAAKTAAGGWAQAAHNAEVAATAQNRTIHTATHMDTASKYGSGVVGGVTSGVKQLGSQTRTGSYDARNLSAMNPFSASWLSKLSVGLIGGVAMAVRSGLKQGVNVNHGTGQKDFFKDLGHTITEAMKSAEVKVHVDKSADHGGGHGGGHDDHGGGHH